MRIPLTALVASALIAGDGSATDDFAPFTNEGSSRGLNYLVASYGSGPGVLGSGLCAADLDGDGNTDIVAMGKASGIIGVYRNVGAGMFVAQSSGIAPLTAGASVAAGDFDADGDLDLAFSQMSGTPRLYRHDAPFVFVDVTESAGFTGDHAGRTLTWTDANGDGHIDLLMACYSGYTTALANSTTRLWRNLGDGTFIDVTTASGLGARMRTFVALAFDFDHDGDADESDIALFKKCAGAAVSAGCEMFDFDGNSALDELDRALLLARVLREACDLNGDGRVDAIDLAFVLSGWGTAATGDIDHSGTIDAVDLAYILANWG